MNAIIESLQTRRSLRKYNKTEVTDQECFVILETAVQGPTARGLCPCRFVLIRDREVLKKVAEAHPYGDMLKEAQAAILVCGDGLVQPEQGYLIMDGAVATTQLLQAAHALDIGSCWLGIYPKGDRVSVIRQLLGLPDHIFPVSLVALGRTDEKKEKPQRLKAEHIHLNHW